MKFPLRSSASKTHFIRMNWWKTEHLGSKYFPCIFNLNNNIYIYIYNWSIFLWYKQKYPFYQENNARFLSDAYLWQQRAHHPSVHNHASKSPTQLQLRRQLPSQVIMETNKVKEVCAHSIKLFHNNVFKNLPEFSVYMEWTWNIGSAQ